MSTLGSKKNSQRERGSAARQQVTGESTTASALAVATKYYPRMAESPLSIRQGHLVELM